MEASAIWTPDGERIIFTVAQPNRNSLSLHWMAADGSSPMERLTSTDYLHMPATVSPDGSLLVFTELHPDTGADIWIRTLSGEGAPRLFLRTPFDEHGASLSPDGRLIAYVSNESGNKEVYVERFPEGGEKVTISTGGARDPVWSKDGRELFFHWNDTMVAAEIASSEPFTVGRVEPLFEYTLTLLPHGRASYDVTRDGRFIMAERVGGESSVHEFQVITNLFPLLEDRVPINSQ